MKDPASIYITAESTPNPNSLRFVVKGELAVKGTVEFLSSLEAKDSAMARRLFKVPSVKSLLVGRNFVTVTKDEHADWKALSPKVVGEIRESLLRGESIVPADAPSGEVSPSSEDPAEVKIRKILNDEIRPALAMDGGDVQFVRYEKGIVTLHLRGACSHCPSASWTLKMGIEKRLKAEVPEVKAVVQA